MNQPQSAPEHVPVMADEVLEWLSPEPGRVMADGTVGMGGHASRIAERLGSEGHIVGLDRDPEALARAKTALADAPCRVTLIHTPFSKMQSALNNAGIDQVDGILLDIGVSSMQLDRAERGFSFRQAGPLDMRMDPTTGQTAADLVNSLAEEELARIFYEYGEERFSRRIAKRVVAARGCETIDTTDRLADVVSEAVPRRGRIHPATRVFQALRIAVNDELGELESGLAAARSMLAPGGRLVVITFHSLEDRIVKQTFKRWAKDKDIHLHTKKVIKPGREECRVNRRARSAKIRVCEKLNVGDRA